MERLETSLRFIGCEPLYSGLKARLNPAQGNALGYGIRRKFPPSRGGGGAHRRAAGGGGGVGWGGGGGGAPGRGGGLRGHHTPRVPLRFASLCPPAGLTCPFGAQRIARASHPQGAASRRSALGWVDLPLRGATDHR